LSRMHGLSVQERSYTLLYTQCLRRYPELAPMLPKPEIVRDAPPSRYSYQTTTAPPPPPSADASAFFRPRPRADGCAFCVQPGHRVRECPAAQEYVHTGRASIRDGRICLPNGRHVPNDSSGRGIKAGIDAWLAAQQAASAPVPVATSRPALDFERVRGPMACIEEIDTFEVFAAERKKRASKAAKLPELTAALSTSEPPTPAKAPAMSMPAALVPAKTPSLSTPASLPAPLPAPSPATPAPSPAPLPAPSSTPSSAPLRAPLRAPSPAPSPAKLRV
jgi:hypothetical protein